MQHLLAVLAPLVPEPAVRLTAAVDTRASLLVTDPAMLTASRAMSARRSEPIAWTS